MNYQKQQKTSANEGMDIFVFFEGLWKLTKIFFEITQNAISNIAQKSTDFFIVFVPVLLLPFSMGYHLLHLKALHFLWPSLFSLKVIIFLSKAPLWVHISGCYSFMFFWIILFFGLGTFFQKKSYQESLDLVGLRNAKGGNASIVKVTKKDAYRKQLLIQGPGIGIHRFQAKEKDLESAFGALIEDIKPTRNQKHILINLTTMNLPRKCDYEELQDCIEEPYTFLVGESLAGVELCDMDSLPHLMLAGVTRSGKSNFLKQLLLSLLDHSEHLQMVLVDLKGGVEMKGFSQLPNVKVTKDSGEAVTCLSQVNEELKRRFAYLEKRGFKSIDPERDEMDRIVVAVDEASDLYAKGGLSKADKELIEEAQQYTDQIAKKGGAAAIHLIICTQKFVKEVIPTVIADNLTGKMCFRVTSRPASQNVLGTDDAFGLSKVAGRAIWRVGNKLMEVQTPYIPDDILQERIALIKEAWETKEKKNFCSVVDSQEGEEANSAVDEQLSKNSKEEDLKNAKSDYHPKG